MSVSPTESRSAQTDNLLLAEQACLRRLASNPFDTDALRTLGDIQQSLGRMADAVSSYNEALRLSPDDVGATRGLGNALYLLGRYVDAAASYRQVIALSPADADAHCNLGAALADQSLLAESIPCYQEALRLRPEFVSARYNLGNALRLLDRPAEAADSYAQALHLEPNFAEGHNNLGIALYRQGRLAEAITSYRQALALKPAWSRAHTNLGLALAESGRLAEALASYEHALRLEPNSADAHHNRALALLLLGDLDLGLREYEWRWKCSDFTPLAFPQPAWTGTPLEGRTILLYTEQGMGDTLQFVRFARRAQERGGRVVLAAPEALHPILSGCEGIDALVSRDVQPPAFDLHCPLMSVPAVLGVTLASIPAEIPYLRTDPALVNRWRRELAAVKGFKVGIAWQGNPRVVHDYKRSIPLRTFEPLTRVEGVRLVSLQKGFGTDQIAALAGRFQVIDLQGRLEETAGALMDTAALMASLDLVITCDTVIAHLAGALGVPAWVALPAVPDWRWLLDRDDSPWYPTLRLFRQTHVGSWIQPFERIASALVNAVSTASATQARPSCVRDGPPARD